MFEIYKSVIEIFWDNERLSLVNKKFSTKKKRILPLMRIVLGHRFQFRSILHWRYHLREAKKKDIFLGCDRTHDFRIRPAVCLLTELRVDTRQLWRVYNVTPRPHVSGYFLKGIFFSFEPPLHSFLLYEWMDENGGFRIGWFQPWIIIIRLTLRVLYRGCFRISEC